MSIEPEISIVISFLFFCWLFAVKIYPFITKGLDEHIDFVKKQIAEAEQMRKKAEVALQEANARKKEIDELIVANKLKSEEKIKKLQRENDALIKMLRERHEASLKSQLEAEVIKQRNLLIDRLSDLIMQKISENFKGEEYKFTTSLKKNDLKKLLGTNNRPAA